MFLVTNFYFRHYEFLCSSLSFFENAALIVYIMNYHFGMVKIVSVLLSMFTSENILKNDFEITVCHSVRYYVNGVCTRKKCKSGQPPKTTFPLEHLMGLYAPHGHWTCAKNSNTLILSKQMHFMSPILPLSACMCLTDRR